MQRGLLLEIDLRHLLHNLTEIKRRVKRPIIAVVKADAYGHGAVEVSKTLQNAGVDLFAVAFLSEALELRESGINTDILVLFERDASEEFLDRDLIPVINSIHFARELSKIALRRNRKLRVHLNIDTGMGRVGLNGESVQTEIEEVLRLEGLQPVGLMTHFPEADSEEREYSIRQIRTLLQVREYLIQRVGPLICHAANSHAILNLPESYMDMVRPGLMLYGGLQTEAMDIRQVMTVRSFIADIRRVKKGTSISYGRTFITTRQSLIGVVPAGYADGVPRSLSNNFSVLVKGRRVPVVGRVCMDLTMVDLTDLEEVDEGEEVVFLGVQGGEMIGVEEIARAAGTIPYEIMTTMGRSRRRIYRHAEETG